MTKAPEHTTKTPDGLDDLLNQVAQGTEFHFQSGLCGDWTLLAQHPENAAIHLVTEGDCWVGFSADENDSIALHGGDVIFVNQGVSHFLSHSPIAGPSTAEDIAHYCQVEHQQHGVVCYDIHSPSATTDTVFRLLPPWVILNQHQQAATLQAVISMIRAETKHASAGAQAVIQRLSDVLAIHLLRAVLNENKELSGPLAALKDKHLKTLVLAIIDEPGGDWTVENMAKQVFLSSSAFAERCHKVLGLAPKKLVDQLRLQRARSLLKNSTLPLELVAEQLGYQSATAFGRFFKKYAGVSASDYRQQR